MRDIKEKLCYTDVNQANDYENDNEGGVERNYEMPDGRKIVIGNERFKAPEILFQPDITG